MWNNFVEKIQIKETRSVNRSNFIPEDCATVIIHQSEIINGMGKNTGVYTKEAYNGE